MAGSTGFPDQPTATNVLKNIMVLLGHLEVTGI